jgi:uncharacterized repeat protein (TIGR02543 family)
VDATVSVYLDPEDGRPASGLPLKAGSGSQSTTEKTHYAAGYHRVKLDRAVTIPAGHKYSVVVEFEHAGAARLSVEGMGRDISSNPGESYVSYNGTRWYDLNAQGYGNSTIKVFSNDTTAPRYTVTFDPNGGTGTMDVQTLTHGESVTLPASGFSRDDHLFTGWNTKADGTGTAVADQARYTATATVTLYAQWSETGAPTPSEPAIPSSITDTLRRILDMITEMIHHLVEMLSGIGHA